MFFAGQLAQFAHSQTVGGGIANREEKVSGTAFVLSLVSQRATRLWGSTGSFGSGLFGALAAGLVGIGKSLAQGNFGS
jgi:hypothetical protein